jgi:hypothetical protein
LSALMRWSFPLHSIMIWSFIFNPIIN